MPLHLLQPLFGLILGLGMAIFHRPIADFILHQERNLAILFHAAGLPRLPLATQNQSRNLYFILGILLASSEVGRLWLMSR